MFLNTFFGAMIRCVISHTAYKFILAKSLGHFVVGLAEHTVSKSMDVNLKRRRKKGGTFMVLLRWDADML